MFKIIRNMMIVTVIFTVIFIVTYIENKDSRIKFNNKLVVGISDDLNVMDIQLNKFSEREKLQYEKVLDKLLLNELKVTRNGKYIKELLNIYENSDVPLDVLLSMHSEESGVYPGTNILKSYIPIENKVVQWGEVEGNGFYNLKSLDKNDIQSLQEYESGISKDLPFNINSINPTSGSAKYDQNVFQINENQMVSRGLDVHNIADQVTYVEQNLEVVEDAIRKGSFADQNLGILQDIYHNTGAGGYLTGVPFGVKSSKGLQDIEENRTKSYGYFIKDLDRIAGRISQIPNLSDKDKIRILIFDALFKEDYYILVESYDVLQGRNIYSGSSTVTSFMDLTSSDAGNISVLSSYNKWASFYNMEVLPLDSRGRDKLSNMFLERRKTYKDALLEKGESYAPYANEDNIVRSLFAKIDNGLIKVRDERTNVYGGEHNIVHVTNLVNFRRNIKSRLDTGKVYAEMLFAGGVSSVNPNDSSTYLTEGGMSEVATISGDIYRTPTGGFDNGVYINNQIKITEDLIESVTENLIIHTDGNVLENWFGEDNLYPMYQYRNGKDYLKKNIEQSKLRVRGYSMGSVVSSVRLLDYLGDMYNGFKREPELIEEFQGNGYGLYKLSRGITYKVTKGKIAFPLEIENGYFKSSGLLGTNPFDTVGIGGNDVHMGNDFYQVAGPNPNLIATTTGVIYTDYSSVPESVKSLGIDSLPCSRYGTFWLVEYESGNTINPVNVSVYTHASVRPIQLNGVRVTQGTKVGVLGDKGSEGSNHLHFEFYTVNNNTKRPWSWEDLYTVKVFGNNVLTESFYAAHNLVYD